MVHSNCSRLICWSNACFFAFLSFSFIALSLLIALPFHSLILALSFFYSLSTAMATSPDKETLPPANFFAFDLGIKRSSGSRCLDVCIIELGGCQEIENTMDCPADLCSVKQLNINVN